MQLVQFPAKIGGCELRASVCVEHDAFRYTSVLYSIMKCINGKKTVNFTANPTGNNLTGIQIQNGADIVKAFTNANIGKVANPDQIGRFLIKLLSK